MKKLLLCATVFFCLLSPNLLIGQEKKETKLEKAQRRYLLRQLLTASDESSGLIRELELTEHQADKLSEIQDLYAERSKDMMGIVQKTMAIHGDRTLSESERQSALREAMKERDEKFGKILDEALVVMDDVLLPQQVKRLRQIALQKQLMEQTQGNKFEMIVALSDRLDLTTSQKSNLKKQAKNLQTQYLKELQALQAKYEAKITTVLPDAAKEKLRELVGDVFYEGK